MLAVPLPSTDRPPGAGGLSVLTEIAALLAVERAAREYARHSHGNMVGDAYRRREEARDALLDALSRLDCARGTAA